MPAEQWLWWQEFFRLEPWGGVHEDLRFGFLLQELHNAWHDGKKDPEYWFPSLRDGGPDADPDDPKRRAKRIKAKLAMWRAGHNARR